MLDVDREKCKIVAGHVSGVSEYPVNSPLALHEEFSPAQMFLSLRARATSARSQCNFLQRCFRLAVREKQAIGFLVSIGKLRVAEPS